ncbi:DUF2281 domain-containing protein [Nitrosococcus wardiae]|uniref:DUF2281 domain-containing protein n=1 Tax=Nitrosococcus wardiae TaxID=1814290 RepID=A0A4P7C089_9GAMM|nr:DUF2281 domain-containing protein [Nitrosococcus wardiae]QBQ55958.1 DUF2281 domain-containing protein [Nitrosococcus wardiae]
MSTVDKLIKEVQKLPEPLAKEVLDFIEFIEFKHGLRDQEIRELQLTQEPAMRHVWDNAEDEIWNDM